MTEDVSNRVIDAEAFYIRTTFYTSLMLVALYGILLVKIYRSN